MKRYLRKMSAVLFVVLLLMIFAPTALATVGDTGTDGDFDWIELADGSVAVTAYSGAGGAVTVPSQLSGKDVSVINSDVFAGDTTITSVVIESLISELLDETFKDCTGLQSVTLPSSISALGHSVFWGCSALNEFPAIDNITSIGNSAFYQCLSLPNATIPAGVTSPGLGMGLFTGCDALTALEFACDQNAVPYNIYSVYQGCGNLTNVTFSGSWTEIGSGAFSSYTKLETVSLPEGVTLIGAGAFNQCTLLSTINIPSTVTEIGSQAFFICPALPNVTLPDGLATLGNQAFSNCTSITQAKIPASVTTLGDAIFAGCDNLADLEFACDQPGGSYAAYSIYAGCGNLTNVTFSGSWTSIGSGAFAGYANIEKVSLPEGLTTIDAGAFNGCSSLTDINFPSTLTNIGSGAFGYCTSLEIISLPNTPITFGGGVFSDCFALKEVTLPANITMISDSMFYGCMNLTKVNFLTTGAVFPAGGVFTDTDINSDGMYGYDGSTAQAYAAAYSHPFHIIQVISFDSQGGSAVGDVYSSKGQTVNAPDEPTRDGYDFKGWFETTAYNNEIVFPYTVDGDVTFYAKWEREIENPETGDGQIYVVYITMAAFLTAAFAVVILGRSAAQR